MNKTLLVAALSALAAGSAYAQSSVTVYGRLNTTAESVDFNGATTKQLVNDASRLGFKGSEDLGGGLRAGFQLEHGFNVDTGTPSSSAFWNRQSEVNLSGAFGTIRVGRFFSEAYFASADYVSMHNHDTGDSEDALYAYIGRNINKVAYRLPTIVQGLSVEGSVSAAEGVPGQTKTWDGAVNYKSGVLALGAGYEKNGTANQTVVRALVDLGSFIFGGYYQRDTNGWAAELGLPQSTSFGTRNNFRVSGAYLFGTSEFHLNFGSAGSYSNVASSSAKQGTVAYNYNLSKRTKIYTYYTKVSDSAAQIYLKGNFSPTNGPLAAGTRNYSALAFGLRHNF
jgi:predicted porin